MSQTWQKMFETRQLDDTWYLYAAGEEVSLVDRETLQLLLKQQLPMRGHKDGNRNGNLGDAAVG
jgi:hypothetical protein